MRVSELMTKKVMSCRTSDTLSAAAKLMWDCDCGAAPVLDPQGVVKGMITDRDVCMACFTRDKTPSALLVQEAMSNGLHACRPDSPVSEAEKIMRGHQVRRIPIVDEHAHLVGVLSLADIAREAERQRNSPRKDIESDEVLETLGTICQPQGAARAH